MTRALPLLLTLALGTLSCWGEGPTGPQTQLEELADARMAWADTGLTDYTYAYQQECTFCAMDPVDIRVEDGVIVSALSREDGLPVVLGASPFRTIEGLHDRIEWFLLRDDPGGVIVAVTYDLINGMPVEGDLDVVRSVDEEVVWVAWDLRVP
jgi:hypothetical protein